MLLILWATLADCGACLDVETVFEKHAPQRIEIDCSVGSCIESIKTTPSRFMRTALLSDLSLPLAQVAGPRRWVTLTADVDEGSDVVNEK
jgi:hypothetical protein